MDLKKILTRTWAGLIYCLIIVGCILLELPGVVLLGALLSVLACVEFAKICHDLNRRTAPALILDIAGCIALCFGYLIWPLIVWLLIMLMRVIEELYLNSENPLRDLAHSFMSQIYIGLPMLCMTSIANWVGPRVVMALFFLLWINDTGAFLCGCSFGRHKLFERISPKKTWEGFVGGLAFSMVAAWLFGTFGTDFFQLYVLRDNVWAMVGFGAVVSIFGTWGDLTESMIKRNLNIKDSGNLIPGHGGILDRIDSLLLASPALYIYLTIITIAFI